MAASITAIASGDAQSAGPISRPDLDPGAKLI
jgi:hypothetical protein